MLQHERERPLDHSLHRPIQKPERSEVYPPQAALTLATQLVCLGHDSLRGAGATEYPKTV